MRNIESGADVPEINPRENINFRDEEKDSLSIKSSEEFHEIAECDDKRYKNKELNRDVVIESSTEKEKKIIPEYGLEEGRRLLKEKIMKMLKEKEGSIVISIAGGSSSGKTSEVSRAIEEMFKENVLTLSLDHYYKGKKYMEEEAAKGNNLNFDQPEALDIDLYKSHLQQIKDGESIERPIYDMVKSERIKEGVRLEPKRIIISEGLFALDSNLKEDGDINVFVATDFHGRAIRRIIRDVERTKQHPAKILKYFLETVEPMHEKYIEKSKENADMVINNNYVPEVESDRIGVYEVQLKLKGNINKEALINLGVEKLSSTVQIDRYYSPEQISLAETKELLRVREEKGNKMFTYKGPLLNSQYRERAKLEFEIDDEIEKNLLQYYSNMIKVIKKERTFYSLNETVFSVDRVVKMEDNEEVDIGEFIEIRSTNNDVDDVKMKDVIESLKNVINLEEETKKPYFEM